MSQNPKPLAIHRVSALIGIKIGIRAMSGTIPPDDKALTILNAAQAHNEVAPVDFPLEMVDQLAAQRSNDRQAIALRLLEALIHHAGMSTDLAQSQLDELVAKAWSTVATMEREKSAVELIASIKT